MRSAEVNRSGRTEETPTAFSRNISPDSRNGFTSPSLDVENQRESTVGRSGESNLKKSLKYLVYVILTIVVATGFAALVLLTLPVPVSLLMVFIIPYIIIIIFSHAWRRRDECFGDFDNHNPRWVATVALLLLLSLILLFVIFRVHSSLKHRMIGRLETWKWLEIALVSCVLCDMWIGGCFVLTLVQEKYNYREDVVYFTSRIRRAVNCFCFILAEVLVVKVDPPKKSVTFYGLESWKWIVSLVSLLCGWNIIQAVTRLLVFLLETWQNKFRKSRSNHEDGEDQADKGSINKSTHTIYKYMVFMAKGLRTRINILLFFLLVVVTWITCVEPRLQLESSSEDAKKALHFAIRSFLSLLIGVVLLLIMKFLLLLWEAREFYRRLGERIFQGYIQIYFLAKICRSFAIQKKAAEPEPRLVGQSEDGRSARSTEVEDQRSSMAQKIAENLRQLLEAASEKVFTYDILKRTADAFREQTVEINEVANLLLSWGRHGMPVYGTCREITDWTTLANDIRHHYECDFDIVEFTSLYQQLKADSDAQGFRLQDLGRWMKMAHKNCLELANILAGAHEALSYLNKIMIGFLILMWIVIWLFLTKIATTEIIIVVTSPLLAATFIFGDTAKTVFQGFIFAFAVHPFDVGDICTIEGKELEVKRVGIWKTTFYRNGGKKDEVLYPNSTLIGTPIVRNRRTLDLDDRVEVDLPFESDGPFAQESAVDRLQIEIDAYLDQDEDFESCFPRVVVKCDLSIKMEVHFKHKKNFQFMSYEESLSKMEESRSKLLRRIWKLIDAIQRDFKCDGNDVGRELFSDL